MERFGRRSQAAKPPPDALSDLGRDVLEAAADGFEEAAIADVLPATDADIYKTMEALLGGGWIERRCEPG